MDITPDEVYARMESGGLPSTSLPSPDEVNRLLDRLISEGVREVAFVMISAGLSGTCDMVRSVCAQRTDVEAIVYDSRILSMGLGYLVMDAVNLLERGASVRDLPRLLGPKRENIEGMFYLPTLEWLIRGGRIGLVSATVGKLLNIRPIIGVNREGKYFTKLACIGAKSIVRNVSKLTAEFANGRKFDLSVLSGNAMDEAQKLLDELRKIPGILTHTLHQLGPALAVHTGPGMLGVVVRAHEGI